jgi:hypothetical protein
MSEQTELLEPTHYRSLAWLRFEIEDVEDKLRRLQQQGLWDHPVSLSLQQYLKDVELLRAHLIRAEEAKREQEAAMERIRAAEQIAWLRTKLRFKRALVALGMLAVTVAVVVATM